MNILIIRFSSMGDVILTTALFSYLEKQYPLSRIYFITDVMYAELFKDDPRLFNIIGLTKKSAEDSLAQLNAIQWDKIIDLQNNKRSAAIRNRLISKNEPGIFNKRHFNRFLLLCMRINRYNPFENVARRYIEAANHVNGEPGDIPAIRVFINDTINATNQEPLFSNGVQRPIIALMPFCAWKNKQWPMRYFLFVGRYFRSKGWHIVILGGPDDAAQALELKNGIGERCIAMAGKLSLYQTAALLKRCNLALGNDTGLSHLARACGVKTGIVYGSTTYHFGFFPYGAPSYRIFQSEIACRPCHAHGGDFCYLGSRLCLKKIKPESVLRGLEELFLGS